MRADAHHLTDVPCPDSAQAPVKINALHAMHGKDVFKPPTHPDCSGTKIKQE